MQKRNFSHDDFMEVYHLFSQFTRADNGAVCYSESYYDKLNKCAHLIKNNQVDYLDMLDQVFISPDIFKSNISFSSQLIELLKDIVDDVKNEEYKKKAMAFESSFIITEKHKELNSVFDVSKNTLQYLRLLNNTTLSDIINAPNKQPIVLYNKIDDIADKYVAIAKEIKKRENAILKNTTIGINPYR
jgi:hypothetical protein